MKQKKTLILGLLGTILIQACSSSGLQGAKTLEPGESENLIALGIGVYPQEEDDASKKIFLPSVSYRYRYGAAQNLDVYVGTTLFVYNLGLKYQFLAGETLNAAIGGELGYLLKTTSDGSGAIFPKIPLYLSFDLEGDTELYMSPSIAWFTSLDADTSGATVYGFVLGARLTPKFSLELGFDHYSYSESDLENQNVFGVKGGIHF